MNGTFFGSSGSSGSGGSSGTSTPGITSGTSGTSVPGITSGTSGTGATAGTSGALLLSGTTDNGVITLNGSAPNATVENNLTFDGTTLTLAGALSQTGNITLTGNLGASGFINSTVYRETFSDLGTGGSATLDLSTANNFRRQFNGAATLTYTNAPTSPIGFGFTLITVNAGAYSITWPASVDWVGGSAPILTSSGTDVLVFYTYNGGTTYYGFVTGKNLS